MVVKKDARKKVEYRHLSIPIDEADTIEGFALWYETKIAAQQGFKKFHDYISSSGRTERSFYINFSKEKGSSYSLEIRIMITGEFYQILIPNIEATYVNKIKESLNIFQFYFITAGYTDEKGTDVLLPLREYNYFRGAISIDDNIVLGKNKKRWPLELFESGDVKLIHE